MSQRAHYGDGLYPYFDVPSAGSGLGIQHPEHSSAVLG
jgi:hypothetical protein